MGSLESFVAFVRAPAMPDGKPGEMPSFDEDTLEEAQVRALYAYVKEEFK
jgi:mono/diheme cytochrome c family protein